jgi:hypothetical protein
MMVFALAGALCGYVMATVSVPLGLLELLLLLAAVDMFVIQRPRVPVSVGAKRRSYRFAISAVLGLAGPIALIVLSMFLPAPDALSTTVLAVAGAVVALLRSRLGAAHALACASVVALAAVGVAYESSPVLAAGIVGSTAGLAMCVGESKHSRRVFFAGMGALPALVGAAGAAGTPVDLTEGWLPLVAVALVASFGCFVARLVVSAIALDLSGRTTWVVALADALADTWLVLFGACAVVAGWHSLAAGLGVVVLAVAGGVLARRRVRAPGARLSPDDALDVVTAALCDQPGAPSPVPSLPS